MREGEVVEDVLVASPAAGEVDGAVGVEGASGRLVVTVGASALVTEGSPFTARACSTLAADVLNMSPERSAEAADELHAAAPVNADSRSTATCSLVTGLMPGSAKRLSPYRGKGQV